MARIRPHRFSVLKQMDRRPVAILVQFPPLRQRHMLGILDVGHHLGRFGRDQRFEFGADDVGCASMEGVREKPRSWNSISGSPG